MQLAREVVEEKGHRLVHRRRVDDVVVVENQEPVVVR
jgi:hypothetical protein